MKTDDYTPMSEADVIAAADQARKDGDQAHALELYLEAAAATEQPSAELCIKIARSYGQLGSLDEAYRWLTALVDASDSFLHWSAGASLLARLTARQRPPARRTCRVALVGSYTTDQLAAMLPLAAMRLGIDLDVQSGLYGQYQQDLINPTSALYASQPDQIVLAVHEGAVQLPEWSETPAEAVAAEAARWTGLWETAAAHSTASVIQHAFALRPESALGNLSQSVEGSRYAMLQSLNRTLAQTAPGNVSLVDCDRLAANFGRLRWFDDRYWIRSKQAVALEALPLLARHTAAVTAAQLGLTRKCLVLDLDNTLWGGVIGEDGLEGIKLGGDGAGEAFVAFQESVLALKERGVLLAVASKNNEADAREVFERHPEMRIRLDDIAVFAANWEDKPANLRHIASTLNIGLDALVFADDNPAERNIVRRMVPEVDVLALPPEPSDYRRALSEYLGFESVAITREDRQRTAQYRARSAAADLASSATDIESFYRDLRMQATTLPFDDLHMPRIAQLTGKTNQFNVTTRRHTMAELEGFAAGDRHVTRYLRLSDRLTDHGLVALAIGEIRNRTLEIDTFLMSCRVIGRTVEDHLFSHLCQDAARAGCETLRGTYIPTAKNGLVRDLYQRFGFIQTGDQDGTTTWEYDLKTNGMITTGFIEELGSTATD
jgi:FkbH-like protein